MKCAGAPQVAGFSHGLGPNAKYGAPLTIEPEQVKGFSLWVLHAVMNGRGDEVIDLAKSNLIR